MQQLIELVRRYQYTDPVTGAFVGVMENQDYARLLGVHPSQLSRFYNGQVERPWAIVRSFLRRYPQAATEVASALADDREPAEVA